jgi:hypothetical protein
LKQPEEEGETVSAAHPLLSYEDEMSQDTNDVPVMHVAEMASNQTEKLGFEYEKGN